MKREQQYKLGVWMLMVTLFLTGCEEKSVKKEEKKVLRSVKYITVEPLRDERNHIYSGSSKASHEATLSFRVGGIISDMKVRVGDALKKGKTIAELEKISYDLELEKTRVSLGQAKSDQRKNESTYRRQKRLYESNYSSKENLDTARAMLESSRANVLLSKKSLRLAQLNLSYTTLKSQDNCWVFEVFKEVNENVKSGEKIIAIHCGKGSEVEVLLPENIINRVKKNMSATLKFDSIPHKIFKAKVSEISVGSASGTAYPVTLTIQERQGITLRSGLSVEVTFKFESHKEAKAIYLPPISVKEDTLGRYVYVVEATKTKGESIIRRQEVSVGELSGLGIKIVKGLKPKQKVVTAGVSVVRDGLRVKSE